MFDSVNFVDNTADVAGSVLYGCLLQQCLINFPDSLSNFPVMPSAGNSAITYFQSHITTSTNTSVISSDPVRTLLKMVCYCSTTMCHYWDMSVK